jgi:hypothetical protein
MPGLARSQGSATCARQAARGRDGTDRLDDLAILLGRLVVDHAGISMSFLVSL